MTTPSEIVRHVILPPTTRESADARAEAKPGVPDVVRCPFRGFSASSLRLEGHASSAEPKRRAFSSVVCLENRAASDRVVVLGLGEFGRGVTEDASAGKTQLFSAGRMSAAASRSDTPRGRPNVRLGGAGVRWWPSPIALTARRGVPVHESLNRTRFHPAHSPLVAPCFILITIVCGCRRVDLS